MLDWLTRRAKNGAAISLKTAFALSRESRNIDVVLPVLRASQLFVIVGEPRPAGKPLDFFLTPSPTRDRTCVTVSEDERNLARVQWPKQKISGADLLALLPPGIEVVVVHEDGGDYLTREQLAWFRQGI